jgi:hypothetical protein
MTDDKNQPPERLEAAWDAVQSAVRQFNCNASIDARCPFCSNVLAVDGVPKKSPSQWFVRCSCGTCNTLLKSL